MDPAAAGDEATLELLDSLQRESQSRRTELLAIAAELEATTSRTAVLRSLLRDLRGAPDKAGIARRAMRKLGRAPRSLVRRLRRRGG